MKIKRIAFYSIVSALFIFAEALFSTSLAAVKTQAAAGLTFDQIKMVAESGDADAQYALGYMYYYGKGGAPKDNDLAKSWIAKAAQQKQPQATKALNLMKQKLNQSPNPVTQEAKTSLQVQNEVKREQIGLNLAAKADQNDSKGHEPEEDDQRSKTTKESKTNLIASNQDEAEKAEKFASIDKRKSQVEKEIEEEESAAPATVDHHSKLYTLQLLGSHHQDLVKKVVLKHHLTSAKTYKTTFNHKDWYVLLYGEYQSKSEANSAAKRLAAKFDIQPWVKPLASVDHYKLAH
jgi:DamX protein